MSLKPQLPVTISAWININEPGPIFCNNDDDTNYYGVWMTISQSRGIIGVGFGDGGPIGPNSRRSTEGGTIISPGEWYHILGIIRGAEDIDLYVNGVIDGVSFVGSGDTLTYSNNSGYIGKHDSDQLGPPRYYNGKIDNVRFYNRELTQMEISALYTLE